MDIGVYPNVDVRRGCGWGAAIRTDSQTIDFSINSTAGATHRIQFNVNGERVGTADTGVTADSGNRYVKLTFGSSAMRTIEAFFTNSSTIRGFNIAPGATIQTAPITGDVKSVVLTDSYGVIQNTLRNRNNMYWRMMELLGIPDANVSGSGGTGWLERGPAKNLGDRGVADAGRRGPVELIVVGLGINDRNRSPADVRAQVAATTQALMLANPRALLFNIMPMWEPQGRTPRSISDAVRMGWDDVADPRRMGQADPYGLVTGTGRVGSPKGDGNADIFIGDPGNTDGLHPSDNVNLALSGHYMYGSWAAGKLLEFCHRVTGT
ncbi:MAG: hypothetical protein J7521_20335 [Caulobacter sp.]|nr:hypothetical protein [Caulobacter sp.]